MPDYWILKTEPSSYSFDRLMQEGRAVWDGVKNAVALRHIGQMKPGDKALIYHTGNEKSVVGTADVVSAPYPDPKEKDPKLLVIELKARERLDRPVPLSEIKADKAFADLGLVRIGRLSVMPATPAQWSRLLGMGGKKG